jgi:hypothetical protein
MGMSCSAQKEGYVVTNNNDTIKGKFKLPPIWLLMEGKPIPQTLFSIREHDNSNKNTKINIKIVDIKNIKIIKNNRNDTSTYFILNNKLWELLAVKDNLSIRQRDFEQHGPYGGINDWDRFEELALFIGKKQYISIYSVNLDIKVYTNKSYKKARDRAIIEFINMRYNQKFSTNDFKDDKAMYNYILDKELELEQQENNTK